MLNPAPLIYPRISTGMGPDALNKYPKPITHVRLPDPPPNILGRILGRWKKTDVWLWL